MCKTAVILFNIAGDGRMDSPGHSAQYCTYTLMENETKDILASVIIDKRMTNLVSTSMEKEGLIRAMKLLADKGVIVKELVTDASTTIAAMISELHVL
jgi:ribonuclease HI